MTVLPTDVALVAFQAAAPESIRLSASVLRASYAPRLRRSNEVAEVKLECR